MSILRLKVGCTFSLTQIYQFRMWLFKVKNPTDFSNCPRDNLTESSIWVPWDWLAEKCASPESWKQPQDWELVTILCICSAAIICLLFAICAVVRCMKDTLELAKYSPTGLDVRSMSWKKQILILTFLTPLVTFHCCLAKSRTHAMRWGFGWWLDLEREKVSTKYFWIALLNLWKSF